MPAQYISRRSGRHRIAAIALFRALLSQCRRIQLPQTQHDELQNLVRNRFKQARFDHHGTRLEISFGAGYAAIDLLDAAAAGNGESQSRILKLLEDAPLKARQPPPPTTVPRSRRWKAGEKAQGDTEATGEPKDSLFDRPLPLDQLSGKRRIPVLVSANQIPMLRVKKPQPQHLSGFLSHRMKTRQKRHDRRHRLAEDLSLAEWEDDWDDLVAGLEKKRRGLEIEEAVVDESGEGSWCDVIEDELDVVHRQLNEERRKNRVMAEKMQGVVDRETALFEQEEAERRGGAS